MPRLDHTPRSWDACDHLYRTIRFGSNKRGQHTGHIRVEPRGDSYAICMYSTDIITYHKDGRITLIPYDSSTTHSVMHDLGFSVSHHSKGRFRVKHRVGPWHANERNGWPFDDAITTDTEGRAHGLYDEVWRLRKGRRGPRAKLLREFRRNVLPRMMLGEWGDIFAANDTKHLYGFGRDDHKGWMAMVPVLGEVSRLLFHLLNSGGDSDMVARYFAQATIVKGPIAKSHADAVRKACDYMARFGLKDDEDHEWVRIDYPPVALR